MGPVVFPVTQSVNLPSVRLVHWALPEKPVSASQVKTASAKSSSVRITEREREEILKYIFVSMCGIRGVSTHTHTHSLRKRGRDRS